MPGYTQRRVEEELEKLKKETAADPDYKALPGHEPTIYRTPEGYRLEEAVGNLTPLSNFTGRIVEDLVLTMARVRSAGSSPWRPGWVGGGLASRFPRRVSTAFRGYPSSLGALAVVEGPRVRHLVAKAFRLESLKSLKEVYAYGHTGWTEIDGRWAYLHAGGAIVGPGAPSFSGRVVLSGKLARRRFPEVSTG